MPENKDQLLKLFQEIIQEDTGKVVNEASQDMQAQLNDMAADVLEQHGVADAFKHEPDDEEVVAEALAGNNAAKWVEVDVGGAVPGVQVLQVPPPHAEPNLYIGNINIPPLAEPNLHLPKKKKTKGYGEGAYQPPEPLIGGQQPVFHHAGDAEQAYYSGSGVGGVQQASVGTCGLRGLMVFYINTGTLPTGAALDLIDKVKAQYRLMEKTLRAQQIEVMWLPRTQGRTKADYFPFQ